MIKPPELTVLATIGIPTICLVLLLLLPFYDRNPERRPERRPIATTAAFATIAAMAYLTYLGAHAEAPDKIDMHVPAELEAGQNVANQSGCGACHKFGEAGNPGPGADLTEVGARLPAAGDRAHAPQPDGADAVVRGPAEEEVRRARRVPLRAEVRPQSPRQPARLRSARCSIASRIATT